MSLRKYFQKCFLVGAALGGMAPHSYSPAEVDLITTHFNVITPENCMKANPVQPREGTFHFEESDALVDFAEANGMKVVGHCLVWHGMCPDWFFKDGDQKASRELLFERLHTHIHTLVSRYRGRVLGWDVVNEAIDDGDHYLRPSKWFEIGGEEFIFKAFEYASEADPNAELYYNDFDIELPVKRAKTIKLLRQLKTRGLRLDGVGIQGHWELDKVPYQDIEEAVSVYYQLGLKVMITEMDIDLLGRPKRQAGAPPGQEEVGGQTVASPARFQRLADQYGRLFRLFCRQRDKIDRVTFWGLHDGRSWLNYWPVAGRTNHPMLFDRQCQPKAAYFAVAQVARDISHRNSTPPGSA
jgi:endo-1,4-beta-xylanase